MSKGEIATFLTSFVGSTAFAYAMGCHFRVALAWGLGWACASLTTHRILLAMNGTLS